MLFSGVQQCESVIHISTLFLDSFPMKAITEYWVKFSVLYSRFLLVTYFIYSNMYMSVSVSQFLSSFPGKHKFVFSFSRLLWLFRVFYISLCVCVCVLVAQLCLTLCDPMDCSPPGSSVHGILQARILEWIAISFSRGSSQLRDQTQVSCIGSRFFTIWVIQIVEFLVPILWKMPLVIWERLHWICRLP